MELCLNFPERVHEAKTSYRAMFSASKHRMRHRMLSERQYGVALSFLLAGKRVQTESPNQHLMGSGSRF
jgi:hypothetical protein